MLVFLKAESVRLDKESIIDLISIPLVNVGGTQTYSAATVEVFIDTKCFKHLNSKQRFCQLGKTINSLGHGGSAF